MQLPKAVLGTMTFGGQVGLKDASAMVDSYLATGSRDLDTAFTYANGKTEELLGDIIERIGRTEVTVATKAHPKPRGDLRPESIRFQLETSLSRMRIDYADILYLHEPDLDTPIEVSLRGCQELHAEGKFRKLGLSNYAAWQVADIWHTCHDNGWVLPTVYQGMYNAITRDVEPELFPCIRERSVSFNVYNPLAGGLLSGRYASREEMPDSGRFKEHPFYQDRYWKEAYFRAVEEIRAAVDTAAISMSQAALRWLLHHSALEGSAQDGVIIGGSSLDHVESNLTAWQAGPLPPEVADAMDRGWDLSRPVCPKYLRP